MSLETPLNDKEFNELDRFLLSEQCPDDAMTMDTLHGLLTAVAIVPFEIAMTEWLPLVWGEARTVTFKSKQQEDRIIHLILRFMHEIMITFEAAPKEFEPLFCEHDWEGKTLLDGEAWASGFWQGMLLRETAWKAIWESDIAPLVHPIYLLGADEIEEDELIFVDDPVQSQQLALEIEANLPQIHRFWQDQNKKEPIVHAQPKIGRNDPCACGSEKKFKQCCGADKSLH